MIAWLAPGLLGLAALAAVPLAIHLLTRSRFRPRPFPALAFLTAGRSGAGRKRLAVKAGRGGRCGGDRLSGRGVFCVAKTGSVPGRKDDAGRSGNS